MVKSLERELESTGLTSTKVVLASKILISPSVFTTELIWLFYKTIYIINSSCTLGIQVNLISFVDRMLWGKTKLKNTQSLGCVRNEINGKWCWMLQ